MSKILFGIDIGGTSIKCGVFSEDANILARDEIVTRKEENGRYILSDVASYINKIIKDFDYSKEDIYIGLAVPGSVNSEGIVNKCVNLGWGIKDPSKELSSFLEIDKNHIAVLNDANAAALGEYWQGGGKEYNSLLMITIGTGVGGGLIIDGKPVSGYNGAAAEIGHMPLVSEIDYPCTCKKTGCLEQIASATGIARLGGKNDAKSVFDAAKSGDEDMLKVVDKVSMYLGKALACCAAVVDPQCFIIGGGVCEAGEFFIEKIRHYYKINVFHPSQDTVIVKAKLGNDAGIYGAAKAAINVSCGME